MQKIVLVSGSPKMAGVFQNPAFGSFELANTVSSKEDALKKIEEEVPDICIVTEGTPSFTGMTTEKFLKELRKSYPDMRIVFLAGEVIPTDTVHTVMLSNLVKAGIYDIIIGATPRKKELLERLNKPAVYDDVKTLVTSVSSAESFMNQDVCQNLISCYSVKPGSGKSFLALNMAVAIAKFGQIKRNGKPPRVALIDGDLSSLSMGALLHLENKNFNLKEALRFASQVIDEQGNLTGSKEDIEFAKKSIRKCFIKHPQIPNLYAMVATNMSLTDRSEVNPYHFYFVIKSVYSAFDIVIADMNSSLEHSTTGPLFETSNRIYFLVDPDFNNIKNNIRYQKDLIAFGVNGKTRYVLNKHIPESEQYHYAEDLDYSIEEVRNVGIDIVGTVSMVDPIIMANRAFEGLPLVLDTKPQTKEARESIFAIANENWKIDEKLIAEYLKPDNESTPVSAKAESIINSLSSAILEKIQKRP